MSGGERLRWTLLAFALVCGATYWGMRELWVPFGFLLAAAIFCVFMSQAGLGRRK